MPVLTQNKFPRIWLLMQNTIGGNASKQALATEHYQGQKRVLEIGCSVGNISGAFRAFPEVEFTGVDVDPHAIELAKHRFRKYPNFTFTTNSLNEISRKGVQFDYVLFAAMLHHVSDEEGFMLLREAVKCTASGGRLVIYEPEAIKASDGWFLRFFVSNFEQGNFLRTREQLLSLVERAGVALQLAEDRMISPGVVQRPYVARFNLLVGKPALGPRVESHRHP
jgi:2-polyprenyl-3-methyl-5-hydroxy-6-metoxy-1,4-benzoquinol methylase